MLEKNNISKKDLVIIFFISLIPLSLFFSSFIKVPVYLDFITLYAQSFAVWHKLPLYQENIIQDSITNYYHLPEKIFYLPPLVYPPWYGITVFWLAWFNPENAAKLWFITNLLMLVASVLLLSTSQNYNRTKLTLLAVASVLFPPSIGLLTVGQFTTPLLLAVSLVIYGKDKNMPSLIACGLCVLSFKPHLGILPAVVFLLYFAITQRDLLVPILRKILLIFSIFIGLSFIIERNWISNYLNSLKRFSQLSMVTKCDSCSSITILTTRSLDISTNSFWLIGGLVSICLIFFNIMFILKFKNIFLNKSLESFKTLTAFSIISLLLFSPYIRNYDYILLIIPIFLFSFLKKSSKERIFIISGSLLPTLSFFVSRLEGSLVLVCSALLILITYLRQYNLKTGNNNLELLM